MILRATVRDSHGDDFERIVDVQSYKDFDKVAAACASWGRSRARAMGAYAPTARVELSMQLEWREETPAVTNGAKPTHHNQHRKTKRRK